MKDKTMYFDYYSRKKPIDANLQADLQAKRQANLDKAVSAIESPEVAQEINKLAPTLFTHDSYIIFNNSKLFEYEEIVGGIVDILAENQQYESALAFSDIINHTTYKSDAIAYISYQAAQCGDLEQARQIALNSRGVAKYKSLVNIALSDMASEEDIQAAVIEVVKGKINSTKLKFAELLLLHLGDEDSLTLLDQIADRVDNIYSKRCVKISVLAHRQKYEDSLDIVDTFGDSRGRLIDKSIELIKIGKVALSNNRSDIAMNIVEILSESYKNTTEDTLYKVITKYCENIAQTAVNLEDYKIALEFCKMIPRQIPRTQTLLNLYEQSYNESILKAIEHELNHWKRKDLKPIAQKFSERLTEIEESRILKDEHEGQILDKNSEIAKQLNDYLKEYIPLPTTSQSIPFMQAMAIGPRIRR